MRSLRLPVLLACLCGPGSALPATASADLLDADKLTISGPRSHMPVAAITPAGHALVAWAVAGADGAETTWGSWRRARGVFGRPFRLGSGRPTEAVATVDEHVVVIASDPHARADTVALVSATSSSVDTQVLGAGRVSLATDGVGRVFAMRMHLQGVMLHQREPGGRFQPGTRVHEGIAPPVAGRAAANRRGDVALLWGPQGSRPEIAVRRAGEASFAAPVKTGFSWPAAGADMAINGAGDVLVTAHRVAHDGTSLGLEVGLLSRDGTYRHDRVAHRGFPQRPVGAPDDDLFVFVATPDDGTTVDLRFGTVAAGFGAPEVLLGGRGCNARPVISTREDVLVASQLGCGPSAGQAVVVLQDRPAKTMVLAPPVPVSPVGSTTPTLAAAPSGATVLAWTRGRRTAEGRYESVVQAAVRDGAVELGLLDQTLDVVNGFVRLPVLCSGLRDCRGSVELLPRSSSARSAARRAVRLRPGGGAKLRLRAPRARRARAVIRLTGVRGKAARRVRTVTLRRVR